MIQTIGVLIVTLSICIYELPKMKREGQFKDMVVFSIILFSATLLFALKINGVPIPNPLDGFKSVISPIGKGINRFFEVRQ